MRLNFTDKEEFLREKEGLLCSLTGQNLKQILWVVDEGGERFDDMPVVLKFERASVSVCCFGFDELALDTGMINGDEKRSELNLAWREFGGFKEFKITGFELIVDEMTTEPYNKILSLPQKPKISYVLARIKFHAKQGYIGISNGLNKNVVEVKYGN